MNTLQIERLIKKDLKSKTIFKKVYALDQLKKPTFPSSYVINSDPSSEPGEHWVAVYLFFYYFISIFILLTRRKAMEALIHRLGNYPALLPEIPKYCCPLVLNRDMNVI